MPVEDHQRKFKNSSKSEDMRRRRAEGSVELRKTKKEEQLWKKRNVDSLDADDETSNSVDVKAKEAGLVITLSECMKIFHDGDTSRYLEVIGSIRRLLSKQKNPPVDEVIKSGVMPFLVKALAFEDDKIQFESAWALTNIASGTSQQTRTVVEYGVVPHLVMLLYSPHLYVAEQCSWALGNIAGDCADLRDIVIHAGCVNPLINLLKKNISVEFARTLTWTISNLCRNKNPCPPNEAIVQLLPSIVDLLDYSDTVVVTDACWALAYVSDGPDERIDVVLQHNVVPKMVKLLSSAEGCLIAPSLRCLGNIVTGTDQQTQVVVDCGVFPAMIEAVSKYGKPTIVKEAMWLISNIAAGTKEQIQTVIEANLVPLVIDVMKKGDHKSQFESCWVVNNITSGGTLDQMLYLCRCDVIGALCECLKTKETRMICLVLDAMCNILVAAEKSGQLEPATVAVEECGGLDKIEQLQNHENEDVYRKALSVIEKFFAEEEDHVDLVNDDQVQQFDAPDVPADGFTF